MQKIVEVPENVSCPQGLIHNLRQPENAGTGLHRLSPDSVFVTALDVRRAGFLLRISRREHRFADARLPDEDDAVAAAPDQLERLVQKIARRVSGDFDLELRVVNSEFSVFVQNQVRQLVDRAGAVRICAPEVERMPEIVVHGGDSAHEIAENRPDVVARELPRFQIADVVRIEHAVQIAEGTGLDAVRILRKLVIEPDLQHAFVKGRRSSVAQMAQRGDGFGEAAGLLRTGADAVHQPLHGLVFEPDGGEKIPVFRRHRISGAFHEALFRGLRPR